MRNLLLALTLLIVSSTVYAGIGDPPSDLVTGIHYRVNKNMTSVAISADVLGDADTNAVVRLFYRRANVSAPYDTGMVMVRRPYYRTLGQSQYWAANYEGRLLNLAMGKTYQFYIESVEPDPEQPGGYTRYQTAEDTVSVVPLRKIIVNGVYAPFGSEVPDTPGGGGSQPVDVIGAKWYVRGDVGNDGNTGLEYASAKKTIGGALAAMAAEPSSGQNDAILVYPGHYHEKVNLNFGTDSPTNTRFIIGMASTPDSVIICGADPQIESGYVQPNERLEFTSVGNGMYRAFFPKDSCQVFVIGDERLERKLSQAEMADFTTISDNGWYLTNDSLYVRLNGGRSPRGLKLYAGSIGTLIDVAKRNWRIVNLRMQYAGYGVPTEVSGADMNVEGYGIQIGLSGTASGTYVDNCHFVGNAAYPIFVDKRAGYGYHADSVTVVRSYFNGMFTGKYAAGKYRQEEQVTVVLSSKNFIFNGNVLRNMFNGVQPTYFQTAYADSSMGSYGECVNNTFKQITDDAIEVDTWLCTNRLIAYNTIDSVGRAISLAPVNRGPDFIFYNVITNMDGGIKIGGESRGTVLLYHNTIIGKRPIFNAGNIAWNMTARNNIFWGRNTDFTMNLQGDTPSAESVASMNFNYNLYDSTLVTKMFKHNGVFQYSLAKFRQFTGQEKNGKNGMSGIQSLLRRDYRLRFPSNAIDTGCRITGVNTSDRGNMYFIKPDMGRYEFVLQKKVGP